MDIKKDIVIYYLFSFLFGFYLANGTTVLFARALEFSFQQIFILGAVYMLMFVIWEIPSGALADLIGRKKTVMAGCFTLAVAAVATGISSTFIQVLFSFLIWALGFSLISGANEALLYDRLNDSRSYTRVLGKSQFFFLIGAALAGILGPYLFSVNFRFAYLFSSIPFFLGGVTIAFFSETLYKHEFSFRQHLEQVKTGVKIAFQNKFILWATGIMSLTFGASYTFSNSYQPFLQDIGFSIRAFSVILPIMFVGEAIGGSVSWKLNAWLGENRIFRLSVILIALTLAVLGIFPAKAVLIVLLLYTFLQGVVRPVISGYSNRCLEPQHRATVISVQSMIATVTAALLLFLFGFLTDRIGINNLLIVLGGLVLTLGAVLLLAKPSESPQQ